MSKTTSIERRAKIKRRIRSKISGTTARPRLAVFRSSKHIYLAVVDDTVGRTLAAASSLSQEIKTDLVGKTGIERAAIVGKRLGARALEAGISAVVFDRGGYVYHGQVKAEADGAREGGLQF